MDTAGAGTTATAIGATVITRGLSSVAVAKSTSVVLTRAMDGILAPIMRHCHSGIDGGLAELPVGEC